MSETNARVVLKAFGGAENLGVVRGEPMPTPGKGQVRVRVLAATVQFTDVIIRKGIYPDLKEKPPFTPGYDVVGEITAIGPGVTGFSIGDRVADMTMIGSWAEHRLLEADRLTRVPDGVDPAQAAALVLSGMTAYQLLHRHAHVKKGQKALVIGAAGAVGQQLLALGKIAGLELLGTARGEHADLIASFGATPIDYRREDWVKAAGGVDVVFDGIAEDGFRKSWRALRAGGFLSAYGFSAGVTSGASVMAIGMLFARLFFWDLLPNGKRAGFYSISALREKHPQWFREDLAALFALLAEGKLAPRVQAITLDEVPEASRKVEAGGLDAKPVYVPKAG
jgi:NADPH:quinone reductase-like Zn-dependent oxidoreductase